MRLFARLVCGLREACARRAQHGCEFISLCARRVRSGCEAGAMLNAIYGACARAPFLGFN